jgi:hypothetical protein
VELNAVSLVDAVFSYGRLVLVYGLETAIASANSLIGKKTFYYNK